VCAGAWSGGKGRVGKGKREGRWEGEGGKVLLDSPDVRRNPKGLEG